MNLVRYKEFIKAIRFLKHRKRGNFNMSEKVKTLLVENMEKIGNGGRPVVTGKEINKAAHHHGMQQYAESRLHDRGIHEKQIEENRKLIAKI